MKKRTIPLNIMGIIRNFICLLLALSLLSWVQVAEGLKDKINVGFKNTSAVKVLAYLERNTRLKFSYNRDDLERMAPVSIDKKVRTVEELLNEITTVTNLQFKVTEDQILVKAVSAQTQTVTSMGKVADSEVKGVVRAASGELLVGVSVKVLGTNKGVLTDVKGEFVIKGLPANAVLEISYIGYETKQVAVNGQQELTVSLGVSSKILDQVVVVGYGTQSRKNVSAAITSVKGEAIQSMATNNPVDALQGRVAGLSVTNTGGNPGAAADVKLRGVGTIGGHQPLYVIDGTPGNPFYLNNNDIASIEVLKDGAAASIYGSVSANGVILITTKKGRKGAPVIDFNAYYGTVTPTNKLKLLDANGYKTLHKMMYENAGKDPASWPAYITKNTGVNTNWQDEVRRQGITENYNLNLRGGGDYFTYSLSGDIMNDKGTFIGSDFKKKTIRSRNEYKKGRLTAEANITYSETATQDYQFSLTDTYFQSPLLPIFDKNEKYGYALLVDELPKFQNPLAADHYWDTKSTTQYFNGNVRLGLQLWKGLRVVSNLNMVNANDFYYAFHPPFRSNQNDPEISYSYLENKRTNYRERLMENLLYYDVAFGKHSINVLAGYTAQEKTNNWMATTAEGKTIVRTVENGEIVETEVPGGFLDPNFNTINGGTGGTFGNTGTRNKYIRLSTLGRINYSYDDKYLLQMSVRRDGSSLFGRNRRYGVYPSISVGWNLQKEDFMQSVTWLDMLKLRASYGELGNEGGLKNYDHQALIFTYNDYTGGYVQGSGGTSWPGSAAWNLENRDLQWETSKSTNIGVDFAILRNRLSGAFNYFNNKTDGLLITKEVPPSAGVNDPILNVGKIQNRGWELEVTYSNKTNDLGYNVTGVLSSTKNKVLSLANEGQSLSGVGLKYGSSHIANQTRVGKEVGAFYLYETDGIFQSDAEVQSYKNKAGDLLQPDASAGDIRFRDTNGDGVIDDNDKTYQGSGFPKLEYGFNIGVQYKGFDLALFVQGVAGNKIYNGNRFEFEGMDAGRNFSTNTLNAWTPQHKNTDVPRAVLGDPNINARESTRFLENGNYLRLKTVQLGYTFPKHLLNSIKVERVRLYISGQNLLTFTKYTGIDPEIGVADVLNTGVDRMIYPQNKKVMVGVQLTF